MRKLIWLVPVLIVAAVFLLRQLEVYLPPEKQHEMGEIPPKNSFETSDIIIALVNDHTFAFQFILSCGNELEVSYGAIKPKQVDRNNLYPALEPHVTSIDFMETIEISRTVAIPEHVYDRIILLANVVVDEMPDRSTYFGHNGGSDLAILRPDGFYEMLYIHGAYGPEKAIELMDLLSEHSPLVIYYGYRSTDVEIKEP